MYHQEKHFKDSDVFHGRGFVRFPLDLGASILDWVLDFSKVKEFYISVKGRGLNSKKNFVGIKKISEQS